MLLRSSPQWLVTLHRKGISSLYFGPLHWQIAMHFNFHASLSTLPWYLISSHLKARVSRKGRIQALTCQLVRQETKWHLKLDYAEPGSKSKVELDHEPQFLFTSGWDMVILNEYLKDIAVRHRIVMCWYLTRANCAHFFPVPH
jgi:hypothetical protein